MTVLAGSVSLGGADDFFANQELPASPYTVVAAGTPDGVQVFVRAGSSFTSLTPVIYADSAGSPGAKIGQFSAITSNTAGTKTGGGYVGSALTLGQTVWLAALCLGGSWNMTMCSGSGGYKNKAAVASVPDPYGTPGTTVSSANFLMPIIVTATTLPVIDPDYSRFPKALLRR